MSLMDMTLLDLYVGSEPVQLVGHAWRCAVANELCT